LTSPAPPYPPGSPNAGQPYSDSAVREICSRTVSLCLAAGLHATDAEDVSQDVCLWLLRMGSPTLALSGPWLAAVVRNYVLRYRRRRGRMTSHEGTTLEDIAEPAAPPDKSVFETRQFLDRMAERLPKPERQLLLLVRKGLTVVQAARALGIPRGSCDYHRKRLVSLARAALDARRAQEPRLASNSPGRLEGGA
jgi:RNA polymerase sigma factor (sigma-70 family)